MPACSLSLFEVMMVHDLSWKVRPRPSLTRLCSKKAPQDAKIAAQTRTDAAMETQLFKFRNMKMADTAVKIRGIGLRKLHTTKSEALA